MDSDCSLTLNSLALFNVVDDHERWSGRLRSTRYPPTLLFPATAVRLRAVDFYAAFLLGFIVSSAYFQAFDPLRTLARPIASSKPSPTTSSALGRSPGLQVSIDRNNSNNAVFSSSLTISVPLDSLSPFTHSSNRLSHDHVSRSLPSGLPISSNHFARRSHLSHHSDGRRPYR
jgi:hypothetical protein